MATMVPCAYPDRCGTREHVMGSAAHTSCGTTGADHRTLGPVVAASEARADAQGYEAGAAVTAFRGVSPEQVVARGWRHLDLSPDDIEGNVEALSEIMDAGTDITESGFRRSAPASIPSFDQATAGHMEVDYSFVVDTGEAVMSPEFRSELRDVLRDAADYDEWDGEGDPEELLAELDSLEDGDSVPDSIRAAAVAAEIDPDGFDRTGETIEVSLGRWGGCETMETSSRSGLVADSTTRFVAAPRPEGGAMLLVIEDANVGSSGPTTTIFADPVNGAPVRSESAPEPSDWWSQFQVVYGSPQGRRWVDDQLS